MWGGKDTLILYHQETHNTGFPLLLSKPIHFQDENLKLTGTRNLHAVHRIATDHFCHCLQHRISNQLWCIFAPLPRNLPLGALALATSFKNKTKHTEHFHFYSFKADVKPVWNYRSGTSPEKKPVSLPLANLVWLKASSRVKIKKNPRTLVVAASPYNARSELHWLTTPSSSSPKKEMLLVSYLFSTCISVI